MNFNFLKTKLLNDSALEKIIKILEAIKEKESDWSDGLNTFNGDSDTKKNKELGNIFFKQKISDLIYECLENNEDFNDFCFPKKIEDIMISMTQTGGYYNTHTDVGFNGHFSTTIFLSDPNSYEGGELCLYVGNEEIKIKLEPGHAVVYPTGIPHRVNEVTSGTRYAAIFWTKSIFKDPTIREICRELCSIDLGKGGDKIIKSHKDFEEVLSQNAFKLSNVLNTLIRTYGDI